MNIKTLPKESVFRKEKEFLSFISRSKDLSNCVIQDMDLDRLDLDWEDYTINNTTFLGCYLDDDDQADLIKMGALILPDFNNLPYNPYRENLYSWQELEKQSINERTVDLNIYEHFSASRYNPSITESLWQRIHDHAIDNAMRHLIEPENNGDYNKKIVGFMGGHGCLRTDPFFHKTAYTAKAMGEHGYFIASGGGPGIMEATNLGAYFAGRTNKELQIALDMLEKAPHYTSEGYMDQAKKVLDYFPEGKESLAIPTWFYGHEPSNLFASHIAKYFSNSIREDTLLAICLHGIVFAPGSAGTTQEIFMDAAQNHYGTFGYISPMVFLGKERYEIDTMLFPTLKQLAKGKDYQQYLFLTDDPEEVVRFIERHPPKKH